MRDSQKPVYVFRPGQLGDSLVALPAIHALREATEGSRLILITDRVPGEAMVPSTAVFARTGLFSRILTYVPLNRSRIVGTLGLGSIAASIRRIGKGPLLYLVNNGSPEGMIRRHRFFFEKLCGLELIGLTDASETYLVRDDNARLSPCIPEHQRLFNIVRRHFDLCEPGCPDELLPRAEQDRLAVNTYFKPVPPRRTCVAFGPGSKMPAKRWPRDRFAAVGNYLIHERGVWPIIFGGPEDRPMGDELLGRWRGTGTNLCGISVSEAAEALRRCACYVGNDTGTMHLAASVGLRCMGIFSARDAPGRWVPYGNGHVVLRKAAPCEGCMSIVCPQKTHPCLAEIGIRDVLEAVDEVMNGDSSSRTSC